MNKKAGLGVGLIALGLSVSAVAQVEYDYATVIDSRAIVQVVEISTPQQQCREEEYLVEKRYGNSNSGTPALLGTIIGGAIGNSVGHNKSNKRVGTVVGAVLGHSVGRDIMRSQRGSVSKEVEVVQRCETIYQQYEEERVVGYNVTYRYNGQDYRVRTDSDPGERIRVRVSVQPVL